MSRIAVSSASPSRFAVSALSVPVPGASAGAAPAIAGAGAAAFTAAAAAAAGTNSAFLFTFSHALLARRGSTASGRDDDEDAYASRGSFDEYDELADNSALAQDDPRMMAAVKEQMRAVDARRQRAERVSRAAATQEAHRAAAAAARAALKAGLPVELNTLGSASGDGAAVTSTLPPCQPDRSQKFPRTWGHVRAEIEFNRLCAPLVLSAETRDRPSKRESERDYLLRGFTFDSDIPSQLRACGHGQPGKPTSTIRVRVIHRNDLYLSPGNVTIAEATAWAGLQRLNLILPTAAARPGQKPAPKGVEDDGVPVVFAAAWPQIRAELSARDKEAARGSSSSKDVVLTPTTLPSDVHRRVMQAWEFILAGDSVKFALLDTTGSRVKAAIMAATTTGGTVDMRNMSKETAEKVSRHMRRVEKSGPARSRPRGGSMGDDDGNSGDGDGGGDDFSGREDRRGAAGGSGGKMSKKELEAKKFNAAIAKREAGAPLTAEEEGLIEARAAAAPTTDVIALSFQLLMKGVGFLIQRRLEVIIRHSAAGLMRHQLLELRAAVAATQAGSAEADAAEAAFSAAAAAAAERAGVALVGATTAAAHAAEKETGKRGKIVPVPEQLESPLAMLRRVDEVNAPLSQDARIESEQAKANIYFSVPAADAGRPRTQFLATPGSQRKIEAEEAKLARLWGEGSEIYSAVIKGDWNALAATKKKADAAPADVASAGAEEGAADGDGAAPAGK